MKNFADYIRNLRLTKKNLSLRSAAEKIGIASPYLSRIEAGIEKPPSQDVLRKMAEVYEVDFKDLIEKAANRAKEVYGDLVVSSPALNVFFKMVRDFSEEELLEAIKAICEKNKVDPQAFLDEVQKRKATLPRLRKVNEGMFAADIAPRYLSKKMVEDLAYRFLEKHGLTRTTYTPSTPIELLAEKEDGVRILIDDKLKMFQSGEPMELGMSHWSAYHNNVREIHVNYALEQGPHANIHRLRFTVAHELFHCVEHLKLMDTKERVLNALGRTMFLEKEDLVQSKKASAIDRWAAAPNRPKMLSTNEDWREWQADYFSACVLMPAWSLQKEFGRRFGREIVVDKAGDLRKIAYEVAKANVCGTGVFEKALCQLYDVSAQAMAIRLMSIGLVHT